MAILPSVTAPELVDRFLERTSGLSHVAAARLWGVNASYIRQLRLGKRPQRLHGNHRAALVAALEQLDRAADPRRAADRPTSGDDSALALRLRSVEQQLADLTRTLLVGRVSSKIKTIYKVVQEAQEAVIEFMRPGVTTMQADRVARDIIEKAGPNQVRPAEQLLFGRCTDDLQASLDPGLVHRAFYRDRR